MNIAKLRGRMVEKGITQQDFADKLGMSYSKLYRILQEGGHDFTVADIKVSKEVLDLTDSDLMEIFLP